jgi:RsiW-degrading membrane proteinase PrsW (M82 family)
MLSLPPQLISISILSIILVISQSWMHWKALLKVFLVFIIDLCIRFVLIFCLFQRKQYSNMACSYLVFLFVCVVSCMFYTKSLYPQSLYSNIDKCPKSLYASKQTFGIVVHIGFNTSSVVPVSNCPYLYY